MILDKITEMWEKEIASDYESEEITTECIQPTETDLFNSEVACCTWHI